MGKADGSIVFSVNIDNSKAAKKLNDLEQKINEVEKEIEEKETKRNAIAEQMAAAEGAAEQARQKIAQLNEEKERSREASTAAWHRGEIGGQIEEAARQKEITAELERQNAIMQEEASRGNRFAAEWDKASNALKGPTKKLNKMKREAGELTEEITSSRSAMGRMKEATAEADKRMEKFASRVKGLAKRVFVFSLITAALRAMKDWFGKVVKANSEATAAIAKLKGALLTLVQPLVNVIIPAFTTLVNMLTRVVNVLSALVSKVFGTTAEESAKAAEALYNQTEALESTGEAATSASKSLASFDEINQIGETSSSSSSTIAPDFSGVVSSGLNAISQGLTATALLAIGAVLAFTGASIPVGIAMMVAGGLILYGAAKDDTDGFCELMEGELGKVFTVIGPFVAVIGIALMVFGHFFVGLAMVLLGIELFALGDAGQKGSEDFGQHLVTALKQALRVVGPLVAVIGIALVCLGHFVTGIAMIIGGIAAFNLGDEKLDWSALGTHLKQVLSDTLKDVGLFVAVIGILLCCIGQFGKGLALILFGFAAFKVGDALDTDWDALGASLSGALALTLVEIAAFAVVIGILLCFVPGMLAHGIGLIIAGLGAMTYVATTPSWDFILEHLKQVWEDIKTWFIESVKYYFSKEYWSIVGQEMLEGLLHPFGSWSSVQENVPNFTGIGPDYSWLWAEDEEDVTLPTLSTGTVTPSNAAFTRSTASGYSVLDEGTGTAMRNIETTTTSSNKTTVVLELDRRELGRAVVETGGQESTRIGTKLTY